MTQAQALKKVRDEKEVTVYRNDKNFSKFMALVAKMDLQIAWSYPNAVKFVEYGTRTVNGHIA